MSNLQSYIVLDQSRSPSVAYLVKSVNFDRYLNQNRKPTQFVMVNSNTVHANNAYSRNPYGSYPGYQLPLQFNNAYVVPIQSSGMNMNNNPKYQGSPPPPTGQEALQLRQNTRSISAPYYFANDTNTLHYRTAQYKKQKLSNYVHPIIPNITNNYEGTQFTHSNRYATPTHKHAYVQTVAPNTAASRQYHRPNHGYSAVTTGYTTASPMNVNETDYTPVQHKERKEDSEPSKVYLDKANLKMQHQLRIQNAFDELTNKECSKRSMEDILVTLTVQEQTQNKEDNKSLEREKELNKALIKDQKELADITQELHCLTVSFRQMQKLGTHSAMDPEIKRCRQNQQQAMDRISSISKELEDIKQKRKYNKMNQTNYKNSDYYNKRNNIKRSGNEYF